MADMGKVLLIANPTAQSGKSLKSAIHAEESFKAVLGERNFDIVYTKAPGHATDIAKSKSHKYDTLIALGGDGLIHETVNGIMKHSKRSRPVFGIIPVGSGNDYAKTLNMSTNIDNAISKILKRKTKDADLGCINGEYYDETLSFGFDAAIALSTMELRKNTSMRGLPLYFRAGIDQMLHHLDLYKYTITAKDIAPVNEYKSLMQDGIPFTDETFMAAVQIGPTYGGGFKICPKAQINDGLFDVCIAHPPLNIPKAIGIFSSAVRGHHTKMRGMEMFRCSELELSFEHEPKIQADGEPIYGTDFKITCVKHALDVIYSD